MSTNYVDPKDERLVDAEEKGTEIIDEYNKSMNKVISSNEVAKDAALGEIGKMGADGKWTEGTATDKLMDAQNAQTEFAIDEIERQKDNAEKDYIKEQTGAYVDWQKQSSQHGVNAEKMAANGMQNSGYAESSKVSMYNQYQTRITAARESFVRIQADYDAAIANARIQNNSALAQIAADAMRQRLEIMLQFSMKNTELLATMAQNKANLRQQNFSNYMSVYNQLLQEAQHKASLAEQKRQHDENLAFQREQFNWQKEQAAAKASSGGSSGGGGSGRITKTTVSKAKASKDDLDEMRSILSGKKNSGTEKQSQADKNEGGKDGGYELDTSSILKLGYGPISAKELDKLVRRGVVQEYVEDGKMKFRKVVFGTLGGGK